LFEAATWPRTGRPSARGWDGRDKVVGSAVRSDAVSFHVSPSS